MRANGRFDTQPCFQSLGVHRPSLHGLVLASANDELPLLPPPPSIYLERRRMARGCVYCVQWLSTFLLLCHSDLLHKTQCTCFSHPSLQSSIITIKPCLHLFIFALLFIPPNHPPTPTFLRHTVLSGIITHWISDCKSQAQDLANFISSHPECQVILIRNAMHDLPLECPITSPT
jgi:hypothetical protein